MDPIIALLIAYTLTIFAVLTHVRTVNPTPREILTRMEHHARGMSERAFADIIDGINQGNHQLVTSMQKHLERMTTPVYSVDADDPRNRPSPTSEYQFGEATDPLTQFHDTMGTPPIEDTPDWTDQMLPNERGTQPRVASVRPGDSIIPGQGNWDEMTAEGRTVANGGMASGEDQWQGEPYEGVGG
jgi:hypothetical protein